MNLLASVPVDDVSQSPVIIWTAIIVGAIVLVTTAIPKILGPVSKAWSEWAESQRRRSTEDEDARINDMSKDITYLKRAVGELRTDLRNRDILATRHMAWDHQVIQDLRKHSSVRIEDPPPLFPTPSTAPTADDTSE